MEKEKSVLKRDGSPKMIARLIYMEPELWALCHRKGGAEACTRSTYIRRCIKRTHLGTCGKIDGINWREV